MLKRTLLIATVSASLVASSAPFAGPMTIDNSKGKSVTIYGEGDEFDAFFETKDGYSLVCGKDDAFYYYAKKDGDRLVSTGVEVGEETAEIPSTLEKHLRDTSSEHEQEVEERVKVDEETNHTQENWEKIRDKDDVADGETGDEVSDGSETKEDDRNWFVKLIDAIIHFFFGDGDAKDDSHSVSTSMPSLGAPPKTTTVGQVVGLTVLVDFPDPVYGSESQRVHPEVTVKDLCDMLNADHFEKYLCNHSVREFYKKISHDRLDFTNSVIGYVMMPHPKSYYNKSTEDCAKCAKLLISDMWNVLKKDPEWNGSILKTMQGLSYDAKSKKFKALSIFFAGNSASKWCYGLWAHRSSTGSPSFKMADGKTKCSFWNYQITPITGYPYVDTFCHECGHLVCGFPDLYDYTHKSRGAGWYSMMANGDNIDPYLAEAAGWIDPVVMPDQGWIDLPHDNKTVYKYVHPTDCKQYFLVDNRHKSGLDSTLCGSGCVIWRCNRSGTNKSAGSYIGKGKNRYRRNYELSIVQADGKYELEQKLNSGNEDDFWRSDSTYSEYVNEASDATVPDLAWRDNKPSGLRLSKFTADGENMRCWVGPDEPMEAIEADVSGFDGVIDKKTHRISVTVTYPAKPVKVKVMYSKEPFGKYSTSNPGYSKVGEYTTYYRCSADGYITKRGSAKIVIRPKN